MKRAFSIGLLLLGAWFAAVAGAAESTGHEETVLMFENRKLSVQVPPLFTYQLTKDEQGQVHIRIADPKEQVSLQLTVVPDLEGRGGNARARREQMFELFHEYVDASTEKGMQFEELEPRSGGGTYCVFTDKALIGKTQLPPNEFIHLTAGVKTWPGVNVLFRLFSNDTNSKDYRTVMTMLRESVEEKAVPLK